MSTLKRSYVCGVPLQGFKKKTWGIVALLSSWGDTVGPIKSRVGCLSVLFSCLFLFEACAPQVGPPHKRKVQGIYHVVQVQENLFRIGKAYDIDYRVLARINRIRHPNRVRTGQRVFIPGATRQLPVEIITPSKTTLKRPAPTRPRGKGQRRFFWPLRGKITSKFGPRGRTFHDGIDISARTGTPIRAIQRGKVIYSDKLRGYGNIIIVQHTNRIVSVYAHNQRNFAQSGKRVTQGEVIARVGRTGRVTGPHLHLEIRKNNVATDPLYYLPKL